MLRSSNKSEIAVLKVELRANEKGYHVSLPKNGASRYDLIIDDNKNLYRVQVKYLDRDPCPNGIRTGKYVEILLETKTCKRYLLNQIDLLLLYIPKIDNILCFFPPQFHNKKKIHINLNNPKAPQFYKKFLW